MQELVSLLDFRADMILSAMGHERLPEERRSKPSEVERDMKKQRPIAEFWGWNNELARQFEELHERNKQALIDGHLVLSHELTSTIRDLLAGTYKRELTVRYMASGDALNRLTHQATGPFAYNFVSQYPGPLPEHVTEGPNEVVRMWRREEEERRSAEEQRRALIEEDTKRRQAAMDLREAEERQRKTTIRDLRRAAMERGILKEDDRCPKCGFSYGWVGTKCYHCHYIKE